MAEFVVEKCIEQVNNRFKLIPLASQRARDLNIGASNTPQVQGHKNTVVALREIAEQKVNVQELFVLLVNRCKEYMHGDLSNVYSSNKLQQSLNFFQNQKNLDVQAKQ